jgi:hypothetical protein
MTGLHVQDNHCSDTPSVAGVVEVATSRPAGAHQATPLHDQVEWHIVFQLLFQHQTSRWNSIDTNIYKLIRLPITSFTSRSIQWTWSLPH